MKNFQIRSKITGTVAVLYPRGHLDAHNVARFEKEIVKLIREKNFKIVINGKDEWTVAEVYEKVDYATIKNQQHKSGNIWTATSGSLVIGHK